MADKLTGGDWHLSVTRLGKAFDVGSSDGSNIAVVSNDDDVNAGHNEGLANARLIVNSKRLLEKANALVDVLRWMPVGPHHDALVDLVNVISDINVELPEISEALIEKAIRSFHSVS